MLASISSTKKKPRQAKTTASDLPIGRIAGLFGIRGELKCDPTAAGRGLFVPDAALRCEVDGVSQSVVLSSMREHKGRLLIGLRGVEDATAAMRYIGARFFAPRELLDVASDEYLDDDLVGCSVFDEIGKTYGRVERVEHHPANDMLVVDGRMLPLVHAFISRIDTTAKRIVVTVPAGLLDDDAAE